MIDTTTGLDDAVDLQARRWQEWIDSRATDADGRARWEVIRRRRIAERQARRVIDSWTVVVALLIALDVAAALVLFGIAL